MKKNLFAILAISALVFTSCKDDKKATETNTENVEAKSDNETESNSGEATSTSNLLADVTLLNKAEKELKELPKFKGKEIKVFQQVYFYGDGRIKLAIQDPTKPENIDDYLFQNGKWQEPQPVQISGGGSMDDNVFPLNDIKFETVANINKQVEAKSKDIEGAQPLGALYYAMNLATGELRWMASVQGTRGNYTGMFNSDGSLKSFDQN
ncbi:hypothetical protein [Empedobacter falsenii]|uniref:Beta-lactamase-inhibitor-like PepSY-like domain-containing protein n=1 Tax=Empedobacter falsenii TaxID=343874 RepID=A0AAW7DID0_9FLAO|nr:hypothetical protein [Empedobacter falsenii]MDM1550410.1 hypothetical protein [Empedobacter falsenii]